MANANRRIGRYFPCGCWQSFEPGPLFAQVEFCPDHLVEWDAQEGRDTRPTVPGERARGVGYGER